MFARMQSITRTGSSRALTHQESREGRIIDSIADHLVFVSVYLHLTLRYLFEGSSPTICLLALAAGSVTHCKEQPRIIIAIPIFTL
jgi:hypothetical protein